MATKRTTTSTVVHVLDASRHGMGLYFLAQALDMDIVTLVEGLISWIPNDDGSAFKEYMGTPLSIMLRMWRVQFGEEFSNLFTLDAGKPHEVRVKPNDDMELINLELVTIHTLH